MITKISVEELLDFAAVAKLAAYKTRRADVRAKLNAFHDAAVDLADVMSEESIDAYEVDARAIKE